MKEEGTGRLRVRWEVPRVAAVVPLALSSSQAARVARSSSQKVVLAGQTSGIV